jgi:opioid growth factor receptor-like protein
MSQALISYYAGESGDGRGRMLDEVWSLDHETLESTHDIIQWLFPTTTTRSKNHPSAPVLSTDTLAIFRRSPALTDRLLVSLEVMLDFYGLKLSEPSPVAPEIVKADHYPQRQKVWQSELNHNYLRLTRMIESLRLLGLEGYSVSLYHCLEGIRREVPWRIPLLTVAHWRRAAGLPGKPSDIPFWQKLLRFWG